MNTFGSSNHDYKYRHLLENVSEVFQIVEPIFDGGKVVDFRYIRINDACAYLIGKNKEDIEGKTDKEFWGIVAEYRIKIIEEVLNNGYAFYANSYNREADAYYNVHAWKLEDGQIAILLTNISNYKKISEALSMEKDLGEFKRNRLFTIMETAPIAIVVIEAPEGQFSFLNQRALSLYGVDYLGVEIETHIKKIKATRADGSDYKTDEIPIYRALYHGEVVRNEEMLFGREDGKAITVLVSAAPIYNADGIITSAVAMFEDITERRIAKDLLRESEKKANALVKELEESNRNKNRFLSVLSHELRNPLAAISAGVQILDIAQDVNQVNKAKEIIKRQTNQLSSLVDDLLDLTRISHNKIKLKKRSIDLHDIVRSLIDDIRSEYDKKGIHLETNMQEEPVLLNADPVRITQILENLLYNALKYTHENGEVQITVIKEKDNAVITVKDNGIGMNVDMLTNLFEPFTQADHSLTRGNECGLGLGLSIVKGLVDLHEGKVSGFSDGLGKGSTFTISLPIKMEDLFQIDEPAAESGGKGPLKLLIIEDNQDFADLLSEMLSMMGIDVHLAHDGEEGIKLAKQIKPEGILCDIGLPGMNGYEVAETISKDNELKDVQLIALTGYAGDGDIEMAIKAGFHQHLAKPVNFQRLKEILSIG